MREHTPWHPESQNRDVAAWEAAETWAFVDGSPSGQHEIVVVE